MPLRLRLGRTRSVMIVAPHADDEMIGAYALTSRLRRCGCDVRVLVVTDGAASHSNSPSWPRVRLVAERRREPLREMRRLGVPAGAIRFLGLPDGELAQQAAMARRMISSAVRRVRRPALVVAPDRSDDHPDHRIVAAGVGDAF